MSVQRFRSFGPVKNVYQKQRIAEDGNETMVGIVEGYLSTWDVDRAGDRFEKGAFRESIEDFRRRKRPMRLKRNHFGSLIGGFDPEELREDEIGLYGVAEINLMVNDGREAYALAKQGVLSDFSVAVSISSQDMEESEGVRIFKKATVWETSLVDEPMNPRAMVTTVRSFDLPVETEPDIVAACAAYQLGKADIPEHEHAMIERIINDGYRLVMHRDSPLQTGVWSLSDLRALPKSSRGAILRSGLMSKRAIDALCDALQPEQAPATEADNEERDEEKAMIGEIINLLKGASSE